MKKILCIAIFCILLVSISQAQKLYSSQNLNHASREELDLLYKKARKSKNVGKILTISGASLVALGFAMQVNGLATTVVKLEDRTNQFEAGTVLFSIGAVGTIVGLPILITGSSRTKRINKIKYASSNFISIEMNPYWFQDYLSKNNQLGATLRIRF